MFLEAAPVYDPLVFVQYGVLGIILVMMLTGWLWPKPAVEEMRKQQEAERALIEQKLLPLMEKLSNNLEETTKALKINTNELSEVIRLLEDRRS